MKPGLGRIEILLGRVEVMAAEGVRIPLTGRVVVDPNELLEIAAQIREALPEEVREARALLEERDEILRRAHEEGAAIVARARETVSRLTDETAIALEAQEKADQIVEKSREVAKEIRLRAVEYADEVLERLEGQLQRACETLRRHREELRR